jgi:hypothetical protein
MGLALLEEPWRRVSERLASWYTEGELPPPAFFEVSAVAVVPERLMVGLVYAVFGFKEI